MRVQLRRMTAADVPAVKRLEDESFADPWTEGMFVSELLLENSLHVVATGSDQEVLGYLVGRSCSGEWHLLNLATAPHVRRRGIGSLLLDGFLLAAESASSSVVLEVRSGNAAAIALYCGRGFRVVGTRPRYYEDTLEDALLMEFTPAAGRRGFAARQSPGGPSLRGPILAIETSCDDSAAAVLTQEGVVLSNAVHSQDAMHERFGGVVPEVAGRAHVERLTAVVDEALKRAGVETRDLGAVAATVGPGLIGALLVGVATAKAIAWSRRLPFVPVNHVHGHLAAVWLTDPCAPFPMVVLVASGGHTALIRARDRSSFELLGRTQDDAAGEAFDKAARLLGFGYPGGRELDRVAESGDARAFVFPIGMRKSAGLDFSFSGVKTALYYLLREMTAAERLERAADIAASYREAVVTALLEKTLRAAGEGGARTVAAVGGVAANSLLRRRLLAEGRAAGLHVVLPPTDYCTDNAAMIGAAALCGPFVEYPDYLSIDASASLDLGQRLPRRRPPESSGG